MLTLDFVLLLVDDVERSAAFYAGLLGVPPAERSPTFAMFVFPTGVKLGLWSRHTVEPPPGAAPGASEIAFVVADTDAVHAAWAERGLAMLQPPTTLDFGRTFVALDPDGHRLRVLTPGLG